MKKYRLRGAIFVLLSAVSTQTLLSAPRPAYAQQVVITAYAPEQLQQLVAPIALYPDSLLGEVLMASTYPLEVAEAGQWRNANPGISGDYLTAALVQKPWDPSVKGLTEFPQVLQMMNSNLDWTEKLGEAFLADQPGVMDAVQQLRHQAQASGALVSGQQEAVVQQDGYIAIQPADPAMVYVPYYDPAVVFSPWPYPAYMPYVFATPYGVVYANGGFFAYTTGIVVVDALWGWDTWDWHDHHLHVDDRHWRTLDNGQPPAQHNEWGFEPEHRHSVPYKDADVRTHFENAPPQTLRPYRGFESSEKNNTEAQRNREVQEHPLVPVDTTHRIMTPGEQRQPETRQPEARTPEMPRAVEPRAAPPMFESFAPRQQVKAEQERGSGSAHVPQPEAKSPEPARNDSHDESQKDDKK